MLENLNNTKQNYFGSFLPRIKKFIENYEAQLHMVTLCTILTTVQLLSHLIILLLLMNKVSNYNKKLLHIHIS